MCNMNRNKYPLFRRTVDLLCVAPYDEQRKVTYCDIHDDPSGLVCTKGSELTELPYSIDG
jgi:hypothetical protein